MSARSFSVLAAMAACGLALSACAGFRHKAPPVAAPTPAPAVTAPAPAPAPPPVVKAPVYVKEACVPKALPKAPKYPDTDAALRDAGGAADRYQLMAAGRLLREHRLADLEKVVEACR